MSTRPTLTVPQGMRHARIHGVGGYRPERVVTNEEICQFIDSSDEWIQQRSGIVTRRWAREDESVIDMAEAAAVQAIAQAGIRPEQIGVVLIAAGREVGIEGRSAMRKQELVKALRDH